MSKINFAIIGTGNEAWDFAESIRQFEDINLVGVLEENDLLWKSFIDEYKIVRRFQDIDELAECSDIQAVYVASATYCHAKQAISLLRNKKHVLCSVPVASNTVELERMVMIARDNRVVLLEAMANVFMPGFQVLKDNLKRIGRIRHVILHNCRYSEEYDAYKSGTRTELFKAEYSDGAVMDCGIHAIHMLVALFGMPIGVKAQGIIFPGGVDGAGIMIGKYRDTLVEIFYSKISDSYLPCEIQGEDGTILFQSIDAPDMIRIILQDGTDETYQTEDRKDDMYYVLKAFFAMIRGEDSETAYNEDAITAMTVMDNIRKELNIVFPADY